MKKLVALVAVYLVAYLAAAYTWLTWRNASNARARRAIELGEQHAEQLKNPDGQSELRDACKGKLDPGEARNIASYVARTVAKPKDDNTWDEVLLGVSKIFDDDLVRQRPSSFGDAELTQALQYNANPAHWKNHLTWAKAGSPELETTRYLLVAKYFTLALPVNQGTDGYTRGSGDYAAQVLAFPSGDVLCEGRGEVHMKETVSASGRAESKEAAQSQAQENAAHLVPFVFSVSVTTSPLHALCDVGGDGLCKLTSQWVGR